MTELEELRDALTQLYGVALLEYHDKNLLHGSPKARNEWRRETLLRCIDIIPTDDVGLPINPRPLLGDEKK